MRLGALLFNTHIPSVGVRRNVLPEGQHSVQTITLGLSRHWAGEFYVTQATRQMQPLFEELWAWGKEALKQAGIQLDFTSITVNKDYACRLHRDKYNAGPSLLATCGHHEGGWGRLLPGG